MMQDVEVAIQELRWLGALRSDGITGLSDFGQVALRLQVGVAGYHLYHGYAIVSKQHVQACDMWDTAEGSVSSSAFHWLGVERLFC